MSSENTTKPLQEIAVEIAKALGSDWSRADDFDSDGRDWRARLNGPQSQRLFLSNTWGKKGMLHISGWVPEFVDRKTVSVPEMPSIQVSLTKTADQMAKDITRRLLPDYQFALSALLLKHVADVEFKDGVKKTKYQVAEILGGLAKDDSDVIFGRGTVDIQITGPDSLRFNGHCLWRRESQRSPSERGHRTKNRKWPAPRD